MENTFWRPEALEKYENDSTLFEEYIHSIPEVDIEYKHAFDDFVHTSEYFSQYYHTLSSLSPQLSP